MASTQLADEFAFFPLALDMMADAGAGLNAKLSYAVDDVTREMPPLSRFTVPAGYTQARSIPELIFQRRSPMMAPSPSPSPR